jgi:uncharacterized membrane protein YvlD (DUF360 family)
MLHTTVLAAFSKVCSRYISLFILNLGLSSISGITVCQFIVHCPLIQPILKILSYNRRMETASLHCQVVNPLVLLFKSLLPGQEDCVFISGHLNLHAKPETGIPYREKKL